MTNEAPSKQPNKCPICTKPADEKYRPFCSKRCEHVDLNRWFSGVYAVPGEPADEEDLAEAQAKEEDPKK